MKKEWQTYIGRYIRKDLGRLKITKPIHIAYKYFEPNSKRDIDNVHATVAKFTQDALQECGVIPNDSQKYVSSFSADFFVDSKHPRIEVSLIEKDDDYYIEQLPF